MSKKVTGVIHQSVGKIGGAALSSLNSFAVIQECAAYLCTLEEEKTKRKQIEARRDILVAAINSERDMILAYFDHCFAERKSTLGHLFIVLNQGVLNKNTSAIDTALTGILDILHDNPLKDLAEFKKFRERGDILEL